ncbi:MAG: GNAT family N-acetyltransferase [Caldilineaceae bacterium]|nr:GNAT family N-acetyltransferase [Caldilineaceae bacterium]
MAIDQQVYQVERTPYLISTDPARLDLDRIHGYLYHAYWSPGIPREMVARGIEHSLNFGMYISAEGSEQQIGFARVISDYTSFAYLADVFVLPAYRGQGLGIWLIDSIINCPLLCTLRSFSLATRDAHELYRKFGFTEIDSARYMIKRYEVPWRQPDLIRESEIT